MGLSKQARKQPPGYLPSSVGTTEVKFFDATTNVALISREVSIILYFFAGQAFQPDA
jgi:hypothetical protein